MNVLGDVLETILRGMEQSNKKPSNRDDTADQQVEKAPLLKRPWVDILAVNREKWQAKHDAGKISEVSMEIHALIYFQSFPTR